MPAGFRADTPTVAPRRAIAVRRGRNRLPAGESDGSQQHRTTRFLEAQAYARGAPRQHLRCLFDWMCRRDRSVGPSHYLSICRTRKAATRADPRKMAVQPFYDYRRQSADRSGAGLSRRWHFSVHASGRGVNPRRHLPSESRWHVDSDLVYQSSRLPDSRCRTRGRRTVDERCGLRQGSRLVGVRERVLSNRLERKVRGAGAQLREGARLCRKPTLAEKKTPPAHSYRRCLMRFESMST